MRGLCFKNTRFKSWLWGPMNSKDIVVVIMKGPWLSIKVPVRLIVLFE